MWEKEEKNIYKKNKQKKWKNKNKKTWLQYFPHTF